MTSTRAPSIQNTTQIWPNSTVTKEIRLDPTVATGTLAPRPEMVIPQEPSVSTPYATYSLRDVRTSPWVGVGVSGLGTNVLDQIRNEIAQLRKELTELRDEVVALKGSGQGEQVVMIRTVERDVAKREIQELFASSGGTLYYSDIVQKLGLDISLVVELCQELEQEGKVETLDGTS